MKTWAGSYIVMSLKRNLSLKLLLNKILWCSVGFSSDQIKMCLVFLHIAGVIELFQEVIILKTEREKKLPC